MKEISNFIILFSIITCGNAFLNSTIGQENTSKTGWTISGNIRGLKDGIKLYLTKNGNKKLDTVSIVKSHNGNFIFKGTPISEGQAYFIKIDTAKAGFLKPNSRSIILIHMENKDINIECNIDKLSPYDVIVRGSKTHDELIDFNKTLQVKYLDKLNENEFERGKLIKDSSIEAINQKSKLSADRKYIEKGIEEYRASWLENHSNSLLSPWLLLDKDLKIQKDGASKLSSKAMNSFYGIKLSEQINRSNKIEIGKIAPEIMLLTPDSGTISLKSSISKYKLTLLDFWASWCIPCRASFPLLKKIFENHHNKGFNIIGISIDQNNGKWKAAIEAFELPWENGIFIDPDSAYDIYGVSSIPASYLLDNKGQILAKWIGENKELEDQIIKYLKP